MQFTTTCSADCEGWSERLVAAEVRRWFPTPLQHHCVIRWAVSSLITKAYIQASCHGVVRRFFRHRWRVTDPRVSLCRLTSLSLSHAAFLRVLMTFSLSFCSSSPASQCLSHCGQMRLRVLFQKLLSCICTRERPTLLELCDLVFLLDADPSSLSSAIRIVC